MRVRSHPPYKFERSPLWIVEVFFTRFDVTVDHLVMLQDWLNRNGYEASVGLGGTVYFRSREDADLFHLTFVSGLTI